MKVGAIAETPIEWLGLKLGLVPTPIVDTHAAMLLARTVMAGTELGMFEALAGEPLTAEAVAAACATAPGPTGLLLDALLACGYLRRRGDRYRLSGPTRRWLTSASGSSVGDKLLLQMIEWRWLEDL